MKSTLVGLLLMVFCGGFAFSQTKQKLNPIPSTYFPIGGSTSEGYEDGLHFRRGFERFCSSVSLEDALKTCKEYLPRTSIKTNEKFFGCELPAKGDKNCLFYSLGHYGTKAPKNLKLVPIK